MTVGAKGLMAGLAVLAWTVGACALGGQPNALLQEPRSDKDSIQLIAEAVQRGEIDPDTATLYRVYAVVDDRKLPPEYRSTVSLRDGTPVLRDARSRYDGLRPDIREKLDPYLFPRGKP